MKVLGRWLISLIMLLSLGCSGSESDDSRSTDVLFAGYIAKNIEKEKSSDEYYGYIKRSSLHNLKEKSLTPERSLIITVINLTDSFEVDEGKVLRLLDLLVHKGESIVEINDSKCNFVDQLIMKANVILFMHLLERGLRVPNDKSCTIDVLEQYKFRYNNENYEVMFKVLSG